jgi:integrase
VLSFSPKSLPVFRLIRCSLAQAWHWTASYSVSGTSSRWQQVHLDTATIDIRRAKNGTPGIHGLQGDELRLLRALRREHPHADFVFLSERKAPLSVDGAQKLIERLGEAAKLPFPIHAHMLRHAAGYALAARGVDTRTLQAFMGHRSIANTVIYTAVADKRIRNIWGK